MSPPTRRPLPTHLPHGRQALTVALLYAGLSALWILLSDRAVAWLFHDPVLIQLASTVKGWLFVAVTAVLVYVLLRRRPAGASRQEMRAATPRPPWLTIALLGGSIAAVTGLAVQQAWQTERDQAGNRLIAIAQFKATQLGAWYDERLLDARSVQQRIGLIQLWLEGQGPGGATVLAPLQQRLRALVAPPHVRRVGLFDAQGRALWHSDGPDLADDPMLQAALQRALGTGQPAHVGPWRDTSGQLRLAFLAPIARASPTPAVVVLHIDPDDHIHAALPGWPVPEHTAEAFLFTRDGNDVLFLSALRHEPGAAGRKRLPLSAPGLFTARTLRGEAGAGTVLDGLDYRGVPALAVSQAIGHTGWWLLVKQDRSELLGGAVNDSLWMVLSGALSLISAAVGLYLVLQRRRLLTSARDIDALRRAEAELLKLSHATEQSPASVIITGTDARIEYVNAAFERISGYRRDEVVGLDPKLLQSGQTPRETYQAMWAALHQGESWSGEVINRRKDGQDYVQTVTIAPVRDEAGETTHYVSVQLDVTAQRRAEEQAHRLAWFDPLTGLSNRHRLLDEIAEALGADGRTTRHSALLLLNVDRFKTLNDALGHQAGDGLLRLLAARLQALARPGDVLARLSADEFALLQRELDTQAGAASAQALRSAQAVHTALAAPFVLDSGETLNIGASVGVSLLPAGAGDTPGEVLRRADTALHRAKAAGGHQSAFFDPAMGQVVSERFAIEQDLRRGLAASELRLYLQPQVNAAGRMVSAEALVRWQHPSQGLVPPGVFIPVAEESDLIAEVGDWVLGEVCRHLGELRREGCHLPVAVNVSPRQFHRADFVARVLRHLADGGADPADLTLEITEGVVVEQVDLVIHKMSQLTEHGVMFSIDDFGTGYSSLAYLKRLPIHELKIDKGFVQDAPRDGNGAAVVEAILSVARHLKLKVVAEGVETREQADFLNARAEVVHQGFLFGRPEPAEALLGRWLADQVPG